MLHFILTLIQLISSIAVIGLVLIQRGKGAEAGAGFGAGASGTVFGARGVGTALSRATAIFAAVFMINSLALAYMGTRATAAPKTILDVAGENKPAPTGTTTSAPVIVPAPASAPTSAPVPAPAPAQPAK